MGEIDRRAATKAPASSATADAEAGKAPRRRSRGAGSDALVSELRALRTTLDEAVQQFHVRMAAHIADVERSVSGSGPAGARRRRPPVQARAAMLAGVHALKVKPRKGRIKDLVRLAALIEELLDHLPT
jgi:hypothetical protein